MTAVSIIIPIHNGSKWIKRCFNSIITQTAFSVINCEVCICNDASTDDTLLLLKEYEANLLMKNVPLKIYNSEIGTPGGVGYSKNKAVNVSIGEYLCFMDIDDIMLPNRILKQYEVGSKIPRNMIIGSRFQREPENSTSRYTKWANGLTQDQLNIQVFTSNGPTVIMPTWFCHRSVFERVDGFETGRGIPEDLIFFYKHLDLGGKIWRIDECLLIYTYHLKQTTFSVDENIIWSLRVERLERVILDTWTKFTIWNAGKQGRKLYNSLTEGNRNKIEAFCDIDANKINQKYIHYDPVSRTTTKAVNIVHFREANPPFVICVKMDLTGGEFEKNLEELNLIEGIDFILFS